MKLFPQQNNINNKKKLHIPSYHYCSKSNTKQNKRSENKSKKNSKFPLTSSVFVQPLISRESIGKVSNNYPGIQEFLLAGSTKKC